jgi:hypothetical protein
VLITLDFCRFYWAIFKHKNVHEDISPISI